MKRIHPAPIVLSLALASTGMSAFAQTGTQAPAEFGPPAPAIELAPAPSTSSAAVEPAPLERAPDATEVAPTTEPALPPPAYESPVVGDTRRAAPDHPARAETRSANAQTGPYLGHGLFNNWGPNDFGA